MPGINLTEEHFHLLVQANRILSSTLDYKEVLSKIMELAMEIVKSEAASILILDEKTDELVFDVALGEKGDQVKQIRLKVGEGIAGWVAKEKQPLVVNDVKKDPRWTQKVDNKSEFQTRSMIAVPLIYKGRTLGVVEVINKDENGLFNDTDLAVLEAFSAQAAISIETARLFDDLRKEKEKIELMFSQMSDCAILTGADGTVTFYNDMCRELLGDIKGSLKEIFSEYDMTIGFDAFFSSNSPTAAMEFSHRDRQRYLSGKINRIIDDSGRTGGYIVIFRDVTEEKREEMVKRSFLSLISHKLKTPLVSIIGYSEMFFNDAKRDSEMVEAFRAVNRQGQHLSSLVDKLLNFSVLDSGSLKITKKEIFLAGVAEGAAGELAGYMKENNAVVKVVGSLEGLKVMGDEKRLVSVVKNLIENAVKFNVNENKTVALGHYSEDGISGIYVEDNGPGIAPEQKKHMFQKFYQFEESFTGQIKGVGLGLALCRLIVEAHGGKIGYKSVLGKGSKFYFGVPEK